MHFDEPAADIPQLPLDIIIERKENLLKSFEAIHEKVDFLTADINFLWDHHALCKHQVRAFVPLRVRSTKSERFNNCPNCFWCKLGGLLQIPKEVRAKIDSQRIPPTRKALFTSEQLSKLEGLLHNPKQVRTKIDSGQIHATRKALFTRLIRELARYLQIPKEVRAKIDSGRIPPTGKAFFTRGPVRSRGRRSSFHSRRGSTVTPFL